MFTPDDLGVIPEYFDVLFQQLEDFIIEDYARRVAKAGEVTDTAEHIAQRAEDLGLAEELIQEEVSRVLNLSEDKIKELFGITVSKSVAEDIKRFTSAGLSADRIKDNEFLEQYLKAAIKQTGGELRNLTNTLGFAFDGEFKDLTDYYRERLDFVQLQVSTGVTDYQTAVRNAVKDVANKGVQTITYETGYHMSLTAAARMCTLTGVNQMARHMNDAICDELGLDLVEVTAHAGARPEHALWQGKIYSRSGKSKKYPSLVRATRLGEVDGLCGANCRHNYYGYYEGSPRAYTDKELRNIDPKPFEYKGRIYTYYKACQRMRLIERNIRKSKREAVAYNAAGLEDDFVSATIKLNRQKDEYKRFSKVSGIRMKQGLTQEVGYGRSIAQRGRYNRAD